jgi:hypothetical protein
MNGAFLIKEKVFILLNEKYAHAFNDFSIVMCASTKAHVNLQQLLYFLYNERYHIIDLSPNLNQKCNTKFLKIINF